VTAGDRDQTRRDDDNIRSAISWARSEGADNTADAAEAELDALLSELEQAERREQNAWAQMDNASTEAMQANLRLAQVQETLRHERFITPGEEARLAKVPALVEAARSLVEKSNHTKTCPCGAKWRALRDVLAVWKQE
jgi:hypothetical protein